MAISKTRFPTDVSTDRWVSATWDEYLQVLDDPAYEQAKGYYYNDQMRIEMTPIGNDHASDHSIITHAIHLFAGLKNIDLNGKDNCSYRKAGSQEAQPDASFYIGETAEAIPYGTTIVDLDRFPPPTLVVEVANSSILSDIGQKRLLYEELGVSEYWVIDVQKVQVLAFAVENRGSRRITESQVLPGLAIALLEAAFQRTRQMNHGKVSTWLITQFQQL